ncbi:SPP1 Gp6-like portal protein [Antricoccus suffuscus]|uniref:SPP1 Gp6-like portal protein n=1 Tax=Antricoccus suffuscus TaxID=1629062 RepID=A0A2T1A059_9ACTN|nr:phage portal protein [Antricoccus suffuscus]PRZ41914.1 SPP1 Gp6-like portal protein [Antricoccus suffuscus]
MVNPIDLAATFSDQLDAQASDLAALDQYLEGTQPAAFLSPESRKALGNRLQVLSVNFPRLVVTSIAERLNLEGFRTEDPAVGSELWRVMKRNRMIDGAATAHMEALALGRSFVIVWAGRTPETPLVTVESARQVAVTRDPATGEVVAAAKRWVAGDRAYMTLYERDHITRLISAETITSGTAIPTGGWQVRETLDNPLGVVPVVPFINRGRLLDTLGRSEMSDVMGLADAVNKVTSDMLVTSEFYARPRRWATGLEIMEDDEGNPVNPFTDGPDRVWQSESPETRYGQFDGARLDGYSDSLATLTQQIGALAGLPPHYLGLNGDQPPSADAIRSAEASLVAIARARMRTFGDDWADVARLIYAVRHGVDVDTLEVDTVWSDPETRTPAQSADAAAKLRGVGVALSTVQDISLGWTPEQIEADRVARRSEALDASGVDLAALLP